MKALIARLKDSFPTRLVKAYGESKAGSYAAGLAFNAFMSMFPLMLGIIAIVGLVVGRGSQAQVQSVLVSAFPADSHQSISSALAGVSKHTGLLALLAIVGLFWSGSGFFASMEFALCEMFGVQQRDFLRQRLMGVAMIVVFIAAMIVAVLANSALGLVRVAFLGPVVGAAVMVALMFVIYRVVPNRTFPLKELWRGALLAGILVEVVTLAFPLYAHLVHGFNTYGATFALFFLLATWLYFLSQFILVGAVLNRMVIGQPEATGAVAEPDGNTEATRGSRAADKQSHRPGTEST